MDNWFKYFFYKTALKFLFCRGFFALMHTSDLRSVLTIKLKCWLLQAFLKGKNCIKFCLFALFFLCFFFFLIAAHLNLLSEVIISGPWNSIKQ